MIISLNACLVSSGSVWEEFRSVAFLEQVCYWQWTFEFQKPMLGPVTLSVFP